MKCSCSLPWLVALLPVILAQAADDVSELRLVPFPKDIIVQPGQFELGQGLVLEAPAAPTEVVGRSLNDELTCAGLPSALVTFVPGGTNGFRLGRPGVVDRLGAGPSDDRPEAYQLEVGSNTVVCTASTPAGLFYGLQTLCQLIRANRRGTALPCLRIRDYASLRWRCFQDDMTRGPSSTLDTLKFEGALGAALKLNLMTFYMEYQFAFQKHPKLGPPEGSLTAAELAALVDFVKPLHLDLLGNQQSFGHFGHILKHPEYASLRETPDVLTPAKEETYRLLDDLYGEVCPLLPFPWFNVCCDETWGLGTGPSKERAARIGVGGVYVEHIRRVHDLLRRHGKRMMMWGDIILQHPQDLESIPKDTIMLTWGYDARPGFEDQIIPFARSGYEFFVCPGVNNWSRILPDFGVATTNIWHFVRDGVKHGALGMINTDWEDDGEALNSVKWHADAWAAECAWNAAVTSPEAFNRRVGAVLFGEKGDHFGQAVELLARTHRLRGMQGMMNARFWEEDFTPRSSALAIQSGASNLLAVVRPAIAHLAACRREAVVNQPVLDAYLFGARRMERIGSRMLDGLEAARLYEEVWSRSAGHIQTPASGQTVADPAASAQTEARFARIESLVRTNRDAHETLGREFSALWLSQNKPFALEWTMRRYAAKVRGFEDLEKKVQAARASAKAGRPLPAPGEIGLALPELYGRTARPSQVVDAPLDPGSAWAESTASHRLGMVVSAGSADRFELPVEVELALPQDLAAKPVRAFEKSTERGLREIAAQLDPAASPAQRRLVMVLPGPVPKGSEVEVHVYLGVAGRVESLPQAVKTTEATQGMRWLENNKARLLLGPEGGHIYRWEVKSFGGRDLTQPGETGWAGFCDMGTHRTEPYQLKCVAAGPALVRYECTDRSGHAKTISLYSGASWIEVTLSEPTPLLWNFDDPRNFAADGPSPGTYLFSNGATGPVGREADGVPAQVKAPDVYWGIKFNRDALALGLATPEKATFHHVAPGSGAGGVGIESSPPASHFVVYAGRLEVEAAETMNRLWHTLDLRNQPAVRLHALQSK